MSSRQRALGRLVNEVVFRPETDRRLVGPGHPSADLDRTFRLMAVVQRGRIAFRADPFPGYVQQLLPLPSEGDIRKPAKDEAQPGS